MATLGISRQNTSSCCSTKKALFVMLYQAAEKLSTALTLYDPAAHGGGGVIWHAR
jgi:hypothetical protein